jgi:two-component system chemotaxis sensor kinase CheA
VRAGKGKPAAGRIVVAVEPRGAIVEVTVSDDGRGIDLAAVREVARSRGLAVPDDDGEAARLVLLPGMSTAARVTAVSGRGVGLDAVVGAVEALHGSLGFTTREGGGATFTLTVPNSLTHARALLVRAGGQLFALLASNVLALLRTGDAAAPAGGQPHLDTASGPVALASLAATLGLPEAPPRPRRPVVLVAAGSGRAAFVVGEGVDETEIVVKGLGRRVRRVRGVSGTTLLPSGRLALILGAGDLVRQALAGPPRRAPAPSAPAEQPPARRRVLLVDDSATARAVATAILDGAGFDVVAASDGLEAWRLLEGSGAPPCDVVVTDVDMPRMDGVTLTAAIRRAPRLRDLPVILLTALGSDEDRRRGMEAGASAYLVKSTFDRAELLDVIAREL